MIQPIVMHQCICDNCKEVIRFGESWSVFSKEDLQDWIENEEHTMKVIDGKHYCIDCIKIDEEWENEIIDTSRTAQENAPSEIVVEFNEHAPWDSIYAAIEEHARAIGKNRILPPGVLDRISQEQLKLHDKHGFEPRSFLCAFRVANYILKQE